MQEAWLVTLECVANNTDDNLLTPKIITSVKNRLIDIIYRKKKIPTISLDTYFEIPDYGDVESCLFEIYDELDDTDKKILDMLLEGSDAKEIAEAFGWNIRTVYKHYDTIKAKMRC